MEDVDAMGANKNELENVGRSENPAQNLNKQCNISGVKGTCVHLHPTHESNMFHMYCSARLVVYCGESLGKCWAAYQKSTHVRARSLLHTFIQTRLQFLEE